MYRRCSLFQPHNRFLESAAWPSRQRHPSEGYFTNRPLKNIRQVYPRKDHEQMAEEDYNLRPICMQTTPTKNIKTGIFTTHGQ